MNSLANMMQRSGMPMNSLPSGRPFGSQVSQLPNAQQQFAQLPQQGSFLGGQQGQQNAPQGNYQPNFGAQMVSDWRQAHPSVGQGWGGGQGFQGWGGGQGFNPPQFGGSQPPRSGNGFFDGDLGQPDNPWKPRAGW